MKKLLVFICGILLVLGVADVAGATAIADLYGDQDGFGLGVVADEAFNWNLVGSSPDSGTITDAWMVSDQTWSHTYSLSGLGAITSASLEIFHGGIGLSGSPSIYLDGALVGMLTIGDGNYLTLEPPLNNIARLDVFDLMPFVSSLNGADTVLIDVISPADGWALDYSLLSISDEVAPVPEPATMLLIGSGLVGLAGLRRKFRKR